MKPNILIVLKLTTIVLNYEEENFQAGVILHSFGSYHTVHVHRIVLNLVFTSSEFCPQKCIHSTDEDLHVQCFLFCCIITMNPSTLSRHGSIK